VSIVLESDGIFPEDLEDLFRHEVFKMLKTEGKINDVVIENMMNPAYGGTGSTCIVVKPFGRTMKRAWPPARRAYGSERKSGALHHPSPLFSGAHDICCGP
jgi:hypothetical protein